jgi:hypothetical protein
VPPAMWDPGCQGRAEKAIVHIRRIQRCRVPEFGEGISITTCQLPDQPLATQFPEFIQRGLVSLPGAQGSRGRAALRLWREFDDDGMNGSLEYNTLHARRGATLPDLVRGTRDRPDLHAGQLRRTRWELLLATCVAWRIRDVFGVTVQLRTLFERASVAELATFIEENRHEPRGWRGIRLQELLES